MRPALALLGALLLGSGCCGPQYALGAYDPRVALETHTRYLLLAPVLDAEPVWGYASTAALSSSLAAHYRPLPAAQARLGGLEEAPGELRAALEAADRELRGLGYQPASGEAPPEFVLSLGLTTRAGRLSRVSVDVGAELDGRFRPDLISVSALLPEDPDCPPPPAAELVADLVSLLPPREPPEEP